MKKLIPFALIALLYSCDNKDPQYSLKYDEVLKKEEIYIDSIGDLPYIGRKTSSRLSKKLVEFSSEFTNLKRERTDPQYQPSGPQLEKQLELVKRFGFYIDATDISKK